ncbi:hypothetical protein HK100_007581, partial [Physocladia obscura]
RYVHNNLPTCLDLKPVSFIPHLVAEMDRIAKMPDTERTEVLANIRSQDEVKYTDEILEDIGDDFLLGI